MRRFFILSLVSFTLSLLCSGVAGYYYGRKYLPQVPAMVVEQLKAKGITLAFKDSEVPATGLGVTLRHVSIEGEMLPFSFQSASVEVNFGLMADTLAHPSFE